MTTARTHEASWLDAAAARRLGERLREGQRRATSSGRAQLISVTSRAPDDLDPVAIVAAARDAAESWFAFEQPDRDRIALAGLGAAWTLEASGAGRFADLAERWSALTREALADDPPGPPGSGLAAVGGFAFAPEGGTDPAWGDFAPASLIVPEVTLSRRGSRGWVTVSAAMQPGDPADDVQDHLRSRLARLEGLASAELPLLDPAPIGDFHVVSAMPPAHFEEAVARAVQRIRSGEFEKVVLAREVDVHGVGGAPVYDPAAIFGLLRDAFSSSFVYAVGRAGATFIGATPELLARREGQRASTVALAGSTRRSADPAVDDHLAEQLLRSTKDREENAIVARRIARTLRPHAVWVAAAEEPVVIKVANIQHLAAPIRAQLAEPVDAITLAGLLHPTPAVGAEPAEAVSAIPGLEGFDRGWYAGTVGWVDATGDGEFCVALRCALLRDRLGRCYAGCGIVGDSEPAAELAESEIKLGVMLPALSV